MAIPRIREADQITVGFNQTTKALTEATAKEVYLAKDADQRLISQIIELAKPHNIPVIWVETMRQLGALCEISVGAATAAIVEK